MKGKIPKSIPAITSRAKHWHGAVGGNYTHLTDTPEKFHRFDLTEGICWFGDQIEAWLKEMPLSTSFHYPITQNTRTQRLLATWLETSPNNICIGNGSNELIEMIGQLWLEPGDQAITVSPSFFRFEESTLKAGASIIHLDLSSENGFEWTKADQDRLISMSQKPEIKLIWLASPNNPTGVELPTGLLEEVLALGKMVVLDRVLNTFPEALRELSQKVNTHDNLIVLSSFSKTFGLPGLRAGFAVASSEVIQLLNDWQLSFSMPGPSSFLLERLLESLINEKIVVPKDVKLIPQKVRILKHVRSLKHTRLISDSTTNFVLMKSDSPAGLFQDLKKHKVLTTDLNTLSGISGQLIVRATVRSESENDFLLQALTLTDNVLDKGETC